METFISGREFFMKRKFGEKFRRKRLFQGTEKVVEGSGVAKFCRGKSISRDEAEGVRW